MKIFTFCVLFLLTVIACKKQSSPPIAPTAATPVGANDTTKKGNYPSRIRMFVNDTAIEVTSIDYNRSTSTFNFTAKNNFKKVEGNCFYFYQQSGLNYQYTYTITYATRPDTATSWTTYKPVDGGNITFDCCYAPLTDSLVEGEYSGNFFADKKPLVVKGDFHLVF